MELAWVFLVVYFVGLLVTSQMLRFRRGIRHGRRIKIVGDGGVGVVWFAKAIVLSIFWPVTLVYFLVRKASKPSGATQQV